MRVARSRFVVTGVALAVALLAAATAQALTVNRCSSKKKICVAKKVAGLLKCHEHAERNGAPVETTCTLRVVDKYDACFAKLELTGGCLTTNDAGPIESKVDAFVLDVVTEVDPAYPMPVGNDCSAGKKKCVGKKTKTLLKCHAKAERKGFLDVACIQRAQRKFDGGAFPENGCVARLEAKFPARCPTIDDTAALEAKVDAFVTDVVCELDPSTCAVPTPTATATPGGPCPDTYQFTANGAAADRDIGWTGVGHDQETTSNVRLTLGISGCANAVTPCGQCTVSGPLVNGGGAGLANRRCRGNTSTNNGSWLTCTSNADCPGTGNACVYFLGPPQPLASRDVSWCDLTEIEGPVTGTLDSDTGALTLPVRLRNRVFFSPSLSDPCPRCVFGNDGLRTCDAGPRVGQGCVPSGTSTFFQDEVSFDCPPTNAASATPGGVIVSTVLSTGAQAMSLSAASPNCTSPGSTSLKCFCQTCNDPAATPCASNADCTAVGASVCGERRCVGGSNAGAPCTVASECPGSGAFCSFPSAGVLTRPNHCNDGICWTNTPPDVDSVNEGICNAGPIENYCVLEPSRACVTNADCFNVPGDSCGADRYRECFTDNGVSGGHIDVAGVASPTAPTLGGLYCMPPGSSGALNGVFGLPGPARVTLPGTAVIK